MVQLPANPDFSSLNIAAAVQVFSYEIRKAFLEVEVQQASADPVDPAMEELNSLAAEDQPTSSENLKRLFNHLETTLVDVNFMPEHRTRTLMRKLKRFFLKSQISEEEVSIFRGILSEMNRLSSMNKERS